MFSSSSRNYKKSNKILTVDIPISDAARRLTIRLFEAKEARIRQQIGIDLLDELCDLAKIDIVQLTINNRHQTHKKQSGRVVYKEYGMYKPAEKSITIANKTAVRGSILAPKTFIDTLLHEWLHHYDTCKLRINSIHTKGFYARLKDIKTKLGYFRY